MNIGQFVSLKDGVWGRTWSYDHSDNHLIIVPSRELVGGSYDSECFNTHLSTIDQISYHSDSISEVQANHNDLFGLDRLHSELSRLVASGDISSGIKASRGYLDCFENGVNGLYLSFFKNIDTLLLNQVNAVNIEQLKVETDALLYALNANLEVAKENFKESYASLHASLTTSLEYLVNAGQLSSLLSEVDPVHKAIGVVDLNGIKLQTHLPKESSIWLWEDMVDHKDDPIRLFEHTIDEIVEALS